MPEVRREAIHVKHRHRHGIFRQRFKSAGTGFQTLVIIALEIGEYLHV